MRRPVPCTRRSGFTLVELLVVIVIIGILSALLIPAITGAVRTAKEATVTAEMSTMSQALASFRTRYGDYPPSRILLREDGFYDTSSQVARTTYVTSANGTKGADITYAELAQRSVQYLRKFFPRVQLSTSGPLWTSATSPTFYDFNGNRNPDFGVDYILEGDECLVFFLGGIPRNTGDTTDQKWSVSGFGKDPVNPFSNNIDDNLGAATKNRMYSGSRNPPLFEFKGERLLDDDITLRGRTVNNGFPGYHDSLGTQRPYAYFRAYGQGYYDPNDVNLAEIPDTGGTAPIMAKFRLPAAVQSNANNSSDPRVAVSAAPNPYTVSPANPTTSPTNPATAATFQAAQSFQIISAGADGLYGAGGQYTTTGTSKLPLEAASTTDDRSREHDNLTSFASGRLD